MAGGMVLREVFTRLGFETDPLALKRYEDAIASTQKTMSALGQTAADMGGRLRQALEGAAGLAREGSNVQQIATAFEALGGSAVELDELRRLSGGLVPDSTLQRAANLGKLFKLPAQQIPSLLKIAQGASVALGTSVEKNLEDVFVAMARQSKLIADNLGTQMGSVEDINKAYAKRNKLNEKELSDADKMNAFVEAFVEKSTRQADLAEKAAQNQFALLDAQTQNLRDKAALFLNQIFGALIKDLMRVIKPIDKIIARFEEWWGATQDVVELTSLILDNMSPLMRSNYAAGMKISAQEARGLGINIDKSVEGLSNGERVMRRIVMVARALAAVLAVIAVGKISAGLMGMVQHVFTLVKAIRLATLWSAALKALWMAIPLLIAGVALLVEDAMVWLRGGDSLIGRFIKKYEGSNGPAGKIARWLVSVKPMIANAFGVVQEWVAKAKEWISVAVKAVEAAIPPVVAAIRKAIAWVAPYATRAYNWLVANIPKAIQAIISAATSAWDWLVGAVDWLFASGPGAFAAVSDAASWLWGWIKRIAVAVADAAVVAWGWAKRVGAVIAEVATAVGSWIWARAQELYTAFAPWAYGIAKLIQGAAQVVWGAIKGVGVVVWELLKGVWSIVHAIGVFLWDNIPPVLNVILQGVRIIWHAVLLIIEWVGKFFAMIATGAQWILSKAATVVEGIIIAVGGFAAALVAKAAELVGWIIEKLSPITAWIFEKIGAVGGWIADGLQAFNAGVKTFLAWLDTNLVQPIGGMFSAIGGVIKGVFNEVKSWIQPVIDLIDTTLGKAHDAAVMLGLADEVTGPVDYGVLANNKFTQGAVSPDLLAQINGQSQALGNSAWGLKAAASYNAGGITLNFNGNQNLGAQEIATAAKSGVEQGMNTARDLAVGD